MTACRCSAVSLTATVYSTVPSPVPLETSRVTQSASVVAVHSQVAPSVTTLMVPVPPSSVKLSLVGSMLSMLQNADWSIVMEMPPTVTVAVRATGPE